VTRGWPGRGAGELGVVAVGRPWPSRRQPRGRGGGARRARGRRRGWSKEEDGDPARQPPLRREGGGLGREEARRVDAGAVTGVGEVGGMGASGAPRTSRRRRRSDCRKRLSIRRHPFRAAALSFTDVVSTTRLDWVAVPPPPPACRTPPRASAKPTTGTRGPARSCRRGEEKKGDLNIQK
jgi:hypothetical protein